MFRSDDRVGSYCEGSGIVKESSDLMIVWELL